MNVRNLLVAAAYAAVPILMTSAGILLGISGAPLFCCFVTSLLSGVAVGFVLTRPISGGPWYSPRVTVPAFLSITFPAGAILWGLQEKAAPVTTATQPSGILGGPYLVKDEGEEPAPDDLLAGKAKDWKAGFEEAFAKGGAEGKKVPPPADYHLAKRAPYVVDPDGFGGATVLINLPEARSLPVINTGLTAPRGEAFYVYTRATPPHMLVGCGEKGNPKTIWTSPPAWEFTHVPLEHSPYKGLRVRVTSLPEAELRFNVATAQPGSYVLEIRKSPGPVGLLEYVPGVPLARVY